MPCEFVIDCKLFNLESLRMKLQSQARQDDDAPHRIQQPEKWLQKSVRILTAMQLILIN